MTLSTVAPSAGWFPDPGDPAQERWWSGETWTEHHRMAGDAPTVPAAPADAHPSETVQPDYVFDMTAQQAPAAPAEPVSAPTPTRPTLPTFEELLAAAAAPAPDVSEDAPVPDLGLTLPAYEPLVQKSYGAPGPEVVSEDPTPIAHHPHESAPVAPLPDAAPAFDTAPATATPTFPPAPAFEAAPVLPTLPPAAPVAVAQPQVTPQPVVFMPQSAAPAAAAPMPLVLPADAGFVQPSPLAGPGLVMPSAPILETTAPGVEQTARHASPVEPSAPPPAAVPAGQAPVGYTASADVAVANRYRAALHKPESEEAEEPHPFGAALGPYPTVGGVPAIPAPLGSPNQPGWQGMPLPGAGAAFSPSVPAPGGYASFAHSAPEGHNKTAWTALGSGALALGLAVFFLFFDRIGLWPGLLAIAAVVQGIVGAVHSRKVRTGLGPAIGGMLLGFAAIATMAITLVLAVVAPQFVWDADAAEQMMMNDVNADLVGIVSAECPESPDTSPGSTFECSWVDEQGITRAAIFEVSDDGSTVSWYYSA